MLHTYIYDSTTLHIIYQPDIRTNRDVNRLGYRLLVILYAKYLAKILRMVWRHNNKFPRPDQSDDVPDQNSTNTRSGTISSFCKRKSH